MSKPLTKADSAKNLIEMLDLSVSDVDNPGDTFGCVLNAYMMEQIGVVSKEFADELISDIQSRIPPEMASDLQIDSECLGVPCRYKRNPHSRDSWDIWIKLDYYRDFIKKLRSRYLND